MKLIKMVATLLSGRTESIKDAEVYSVIVTSCDHKMYCLGNDVVQLKLGGLCFLLLLFYVFSIQCNAISVSRTFMIWKSRRILQLSILFVVTFTL